MIRLENAVYTALFIAFIITPSMVAAQGVGLVMSNQAIVADGTEVQTLTLHIPAEEPVDEVRLLVRRGETSASGEKYGGYMRSSLGGCQEVTNRFGNGDITLLEETCTHTLDANGAATLSVSFVVEPSFGDSADNQILAIWYSQGRQFSAWRQITRRGSGFDVFTVADEDGDGIEDTLDLCPETQPGAGVDVAGCSSYQVVEKTCGGAEEHDSREDYMICVYFETLQGLADDVLDPYDVVDILIRAVEESAEP